MPLGIDIATRSDEGRPRPDGGLKAGFRTLKQHLGPWLDGHLARPYRGVDPAPPYLAAFLDRHAESLDAIRDHLIHGEKPVWEMDVDKMLAAPVPNLVGHLDIQKLLLGDALARAGAGDLDGALRDLEASWRLNRSLRDRPALITQLVAVAITRMQAGALRQLDGVPRFWRERLFEHDFRESFLNALRYEGWFWSEAGDATLFAGELKLTDRVVSRVAAPYVRYCLADMSGSLHERIRRLARLDAVCDSDLARYGADLNVPVPRWNLLGEIAVPNLTNAIYRISSLELDLELTSKLLELDAEKVPGAVESEACPGDRWIYRIGEDGASIALSREIEWPGRIGVILPTKFRL